MGALALILVACAGLALAIALADEPVVDFSTVGQSCTIDADCAPTPQFEGIHATCFEGECEWQKSITAAESYGILMVILGLFGASPVAGLLMMLGMVSKRAARMAMLGRTSARLCVAIVYGTVGIVPWLIYILMVVT
jgi:hypothetical protein